MTLEEAYNNIKGTAVLIPGGGRGNNGQCVQWADYVLHEVYGLPYYYAPAALDWWTNPPAGLDKLPYPGNTPQAGDFCIFGTGVGSAFGHIDVVAQPGTDSGFVGYDSNWDSKDWHDSSGYPTLHTVQHNYTNVIGFLRRSEMAEYRDMTPKEVSEDYINYTNGHVVVQPTDAAAQGRKENVPSSDGGEFWRGLNNQQLSVIQELDKQIADLQAAAPNPPTEPDSVTVTKDSLWTSFLKFLGIK